ncbi:hypothetical protein BJ322DRAFT_10672 [Thelephora terrestris]|uniref:Calmodulin n=1 Tax=Thelephora terrestris TaxID=56493 RepID=A0A9P6HPE1_9AGAM|nr:hypothetical protein BJ322DRAFT_10672 [Thelephora terrestris]
MSSDFAPSQAEIALTNKIFEKCDPKKLGIITGDTAVGVFNGTKLSPTVLGEVWAAADSENNGFLTRKGVSIALRLMGHAQRGEPLSEALLSKPGLPPNIEGFSLPILQQHTGSSAGRAKSPPPVVSSVPPLTPQDKAKFMKIFYGCNPVNGILKGEKASEVFVKSKLPVDKLSQIWNLADTKNRGSLDATDFCIAMYLIQATMSGQLSFVPTSLPPGLYDQASGKFDAVASHSTGGSLQPSPSTSRFPVGPIQPQYTGGLQAQLTGRGPAPIIPPRPAAVPGPSTFNQPTPFGTPPAPPWDITPAEKATSDRFFEGLDTTKKGYIEADAAVPFMMQSNLPEEVLAQIWDLSDLNKEGRLTKDGFAVAFHLIQSKLAGKALPATLPSSLVPPSLRGNVPPASLPQQEIQDLLWDDSPPPSTTATTQPTRQPLQPQRTGTLNATPLQSHTTGSYQPPIQPQGTGPQLSHSPPIFSQTTGGPTRFTAPSFVPAPDPFASSGSHDFLSDDEPSAPAPPLEDKSAEIGNLHNQFNSTNRSLGTVTNERKETEQRLAEQATELSNLQSQLTAAKTAYETETKLLAALRERYANQNADINKTRQELITAESDVSALRLEKNEVQNALLRDKEEVRELQRKMAAAGAEIETVKAEIEKSRKDAKLQKGLLAIARKQLATREAEKVKVENERSDAEAELVEAVKEVNEAEAELAEETGAAMPTEVSTNGQDIFTPSSPDILAAAIAQPLPDTPGGSAFGSPSLRSSSVRNTNPFERRTTASPPPSQFPFMSFGTPADPPVPTQPMDDSNVQVNLDDPFGLGNSHVEEPQPMEGGTESGADNDRAMSPSSVAEADDLFVTPLASVAAMHESPKGPARTFTPLDAAASQFPPIPGAFSAGPDLGAHTVAADEDSSDEDDGPEEAIAASKQQPQPFGAPSPAPVEVSKKSSTGSSFDDVFGVSSETSASIISMPSTITPNQTGNDASKSPFQTSLLAGNNPLSVSTPTDKSADQQSDPIAGKNAFDEAMGVIPSSQTATNDTFGFDSAFEDDFDFAAVKVDSNAPPFPTPFPAPVPQSAPTTNGALNPFPPAPTSSGDAFHVNVGFDNAFSVDTFSPPAPGPPATQASGPGQEQTKPFSFDTAFGTTTTARPGITESETKGAALHPTLDGVPLFGGDRTSKADALFEAFGSGPVPQMTNKPSSPVPPVQFPRPSYSPPPQQSASSPPLGSNGSVHSHHEPPSNKLTPPKPRPTTADKLKEKEHTTRTSRLSIRLPFGKKKKSHDTQNPPPIPSRSSHLTPPQEHGSTENDDLDVVKQLTAMGFSRDQAVAALERSSYDFQRALNSLVGSV